MKKLLISGLLLISVAFGFSQEPTVLGEVKLGFDPMNADYVKNGNTFTFKIENYASYDFIYHPIRFLKQNIDMKSFISNFNDDEYQEFLVTINSSKGSLTASYDEEGNLLKTNQNFKNITPPRYIMADILRSHKGWTVTQTRYIASTDGEIIKDELYKIRVKNGNKSETLKLDGRKLGLGVASNFSLE